METPSIPEVRSNEASRAYIFGRFAAIAYLLCGILVGSLDILYVLRHYTRYPFGDHWIWLGVLNHRGTVTALLHQYNEHRLAVPGLLYLLDHRYFGGTNSFLIVCSMLIQAGFILVLIAPVWRQPEIPKPVRYVFSGFVIIIMLWFVQAVNFFYPFSLCMGSANLGIAGAFYLFSRYGAGKEGASPISPWAWAGVMGCAVWGTFSYGHGILIWPVLLVMGLILRLPLRFWLATVVVFLGVLGTYFFHYATPPNHANPLASLRHLITVAHYMVVMLGIPFFGAGSRDVDLVNRFGSYLITLSGILLAALSLLQFLTKRAVERSRVEVFYSSLLLLALGSAFITALGRIRFPLDQALSERYSPVALLFWLSIIALVTMQLCRWEVNGGLGRTIWCGLLMMASAATLSTQFQMGSYLSMRQRNQDAAALSIALGLPDNPHIAEELAEPEFVAFVDRLAAQHLGHSLFVRPETAWLGTPLLQHFQQAPADTCTGVVDLVNPLPSPSPPGARLVGWTWESRAARDTSRIWVTDGQMLIRGLGVTHVPRPDVVSALANRAMATVGWIAYAQLPQSTTPLAVFAELSDGKSVCPVGTPRPPAP